MLCDVMGLWPLEFSANKYVFQRFFSSIGDERWFSVYFFQQLLIINKLPLIYWNPFKTRRWWVVLCYKRRWFALLFLCFPSKCRLSRCKHNFCKDFINQIIWTASDMLVSSLQILFFFELFVLRSLTASPFWSEIFLMLVKVIYLL